MMKKRLLFGGMALGLLVVLLTFAACGTDLQPQVDELEDQVTSLQADKAEMAELNQALIEIAGPLPASLDDFFPPKAPVPVYLFEMFALSGPFGGIMGDLQQGDIEGAQANYAAFKAQYEKISVMVPEWKDRFPMAPVEALGEAMASGDPSKVGPAMGGVGQVCSSCHGLSMVKAQQKYHWPDFDDIEITDPITQESLHWSDYMMAMEGAFGGIANDLQQGQLDNARNNFQAFSARFKALAEEGCKQCHKDASGKEIPRTYFVDQSVMSMVEQLGMALSASPPDAQAIEQLSGGIGNESCMKCHLVHLPAALAHEQLEHFEELFE